MESILDKTYKRLVIQVSLNGLSFAVINTITEQIEVLQPLPYPPYQRNTPIEDWFTVVFHDHPELRLRYDTIQIVHTNALNTFVPTPFFDAEFKGSYLQFNTRVFETDFFAFDTLASHEMTNVYIPYVNMNNFFIDQYGSFDYCHAHSILVQKLLEYSKHSVEPVMYVHRAPSHFEIVVIAQRKLFFFNAFDYQTPEDFIYYILFTAEQLQLNPEQFQLELLGTFEEDDAFYKMAYTYIRHVQLMPLRSINNGRNEHENRHHFILVHA